MSQQSQQLIRLPDVRKRVGMSRTEIYRRIRNGAFPAPLKLGDRMSAWNALEVDAWISERIAEHDSEAVA